jgi:hypothetical protein
VSILFLCECDAGNIAAALAEDANVGGSSLASGDVASIMSCRCCGPLLLPIIRFPSLQPPAGSIGWATWLFLILAGGLLLAINTFLLITARRMTRGGTVKAQEPVRLHGSCLFHSYMTYAT